MLKISILTLICSSLIITGCANKTKIQVINSTQSSNRSQSVIEEIPTIEMQIREYSNNSKFSEEIIEIPKIVSTTPNLEIDKINTNINELLDLYNGNYPGHQKEDTWQIISYPFKSDKYLQVVTTAISYPNYGTQGTVYSYNYDTINKKAINLKDAYQMSQITQEKMKSNIKYLFEEKRLDVKTTIEDIDIRGFLIEDNSIKYFSFISMTNPSIGDFNAIFIYEPKDNTLYEYNGISLFNPLELEDFKDELYYMRPDVLEKYKCFKESFYIERMSENNIQQETTKKIDIPKVEFENEEKSVIDYRETFTSKEIEQEVLRIRKIYNQQQSNLKNNKYKVIKGDRATAYYNTDSKYIDMIVVEKGALQVDSSRTYNFENGKLIFAYIEAEDGVRLYFKEGYLMRFRYASNAKDNENSINYDDPHYDIFLCWQEFGLSEAYGYYSSFNNLIKD